VRQQGQHQPDEDETIFLSQFNTKTSLRPFS
jgi:hypothetical protein